MKISTLIIACDVLYLLNFVQMLTCKRMLARENRFTVGGESYHSSSLQSLFHGKRVPLIRTSSENTTSKCDDKESAWGIKAWIGSAFQYLESKTFTGTNEDEIQFDLRKREDAYRLSDPKEYPYAVLLIIKTIGPVVFCSGSLITTEWVLTAGHCLYDPRDMTEGAGRHVWIYAGGNSLDEIIDYLTTNKTLPSTAQLIAAAEFKYHPKYPLFKTSHDVGLVKASQQFKITNTVNTIKLTNKPWQHRGYKSCVTTGFGLVLGERASKDDYHRKTQILDVKKPCVCNFMVKIMLKFERHEEAEAASRLLCAKPKKDFGICSGDSGGGLACEENGELRISGINQLTLGFTDVNYCESDLLSVILGISPDKLDCGDKNFVSVFQDLYFHLPWLDKYIKFSSKENGSHNRI